MQNNGRVGSLCIFNNCIPKMVIKSSGTKMLLIGSLMGLILLLHMNGGKGQYTAYFQFLHIHAHGLGNNGAEERRFIDFKNMSNQNMTTHAFAHADHELFTKG